MAADEETARPAPRWIAEAAKKGRAFKDELKRRGIPIPRGEAQPVDPAAVRASLRRAAVDAEVEKRVAAQAGPDRLLRVREVTKMTGLHRSSLWRLEQQGEFPKRVRISRGTVGWRESEVVAWIAERQAVRA